MDFLALVNRARRECGVTGAALETLTDADLTSESRRFKDWINESWRDIQIQCEGWDWRRATFSLPTVAAQAAYTAAEAGVTDLGTWKQDSLRCYVTAQGRADEQWLHPMQYAYFRDYYEFGSQASQQGRPMHFAVKPNTDLVFGLIPDQVYTVTGEYYRAPTDLTATTDDPADSGLPERFHMLIVYMAMRHFASFEAAPEVLKRADTECKRLMSRLLIYGLPRMTMGPGLA